MFCRCMRARGTGRRAFFRCACTVVVVVMVVVEAAAAIGRCVGHCARAWQAITELHAERIGHGFHLFSEDLVLGLKTPEERARYIEQLSRYIADRRVLLEVCLTSNYNTMPALSSLAEHAFRKMMQHKVSVGLCTDNRTVSNTTMTRELRRAVDWFGLSARELRDIVIGSLKRSFIPMP